MPESDDFKFDIAWLKKEGKKMELDQARDLISNCDNKHQFAKTYWVFHWDWKEKRKLLEQKIRNKETPSNMNIDQFKEFIDVYDKIIKEKLELVSSMFMTLFNDVIFDYVNLEKNPHSTGCFGIVLLVFGFILLL